MGGPDPAPRRFGSGILPQASRCSPSTDCVGEGWASSGGANGADTGAAAARQPLLSAIGSGCMEVVTDESRVLGPQYCEASATASVEDGGGTGSEPSKAEVLCCPNASSASMPPLPVAGTARSNGCEDTTS